MAQQWFFGDSETPSNGDAAGLTTVSERYSTDTDCHILKVRIRNSATAQSIGPYWRIYSADTHEVLASGSFSAGAPGAWNVATLPTPLAWAAGREIVAARYGDRYVATSGYHATAITRGHLTAPVGAGIFSDGNDAYPDQPPFNNTSYFVDIFIDDTPDYTPPVITGPGSKTGQVGTAITPITMSVSGGTGGPYTWSATGLPPGLRIRAADGQITGTPTAAGVYPVTVDASDGTGQGTATFTVTVTTPLAPADTSQALAGVGLTLLQAVPGLRVYDSVVPPSPVLPYVLVYTDIERPKDDPSQDSMDARTRRYRVHWICHCVGANAGAARIVGSRVEAALLDVRPSVAGLSCGLIEQEESVPPTRDETTGTPVMDAVVTYRLTATS